MRIPSGPESRMNSNIFITSFSHEIDQVASQIAAGKLELSQGFDVILEMVGLTEKDVGSRVRANITAALERKTKLSH